MAHVRITADSDIPLVGSLYFGIIDRGTSLLQVRPSCGCNLNCPFCSVDAGPCSKTRATSYEVELEYLLSAVEEIAPFKGTGVECHIDSPGEPLMYPRLPDLVAALKAIDAVSIVSLQTNGTLLDDKKIAALADAGLDRVNLSLHALDPALARELAGVDWYDIDKVTGAARAVATKFHGPPHRAGLYAGHQRRRDPETDRLCTGVRCGKTVPASGHPEVRTLPVRPYTKGDKGPELVAVLQPEHQRVGKSIRHSPSPRPGRDFGTVRRPSLPQVFKKGEKATVEIRAPGWIHGEQLGVARNRVVSVFGCDKTSGQVRVKIVASKNNIYVGVPV